MQIGSAVKGALARRPEKSTLAATAPRERPASVSTRPPAQQPVVIRTPVETHLPATRTTVETDTTICPFCRETIKIGALKCKHCGEILDEDLRDERRLRPQQRWNPGVAAVLSFFWPGLGQMYKGQILNGFAWMFIIALGYCCCLFPGFFLHVFCIFGAASGSEY